MEFRYILWRMNDSRQDREDQHMDDTMKKQLDGMLADTIWNQIFEEWGSVLEAARGSSWESEMQELDLKQNPEKTKEVADYFLTLYQNMGQTILQDPGIVLGEKEWWKDWRQLLSPQALCVKAIGDTIRQMAEREPSLKQDLQEYMEEQIKERIKKGDKELEIGYLFAKEPFSPEMRVFKKPDYESNYFPDQLKDQIYDAVDHLIDGFRMKDDFDIGWDCEYGSDAYKKIGELYIEEPEQAEYHLKEVIEEELENRLKEEQAREERRRKEEQAEEERRRKEKLAEEERRRKEKPAEEEKKRREEQAEEERRKEEKKKKHEEDLREMQQIDDFEIDEPENTQEDAVIVTSGMMQTYFEESLKNLQDDAYEKDPSRYVERLTKMQILEDQNLISDPASLDTFGKEKNRLFQLYPNEKLMDTLMEKKTELFHKRGAEEEAGTKNFEALDYQIHAIEQLVKDSVAYGLIEAGKGLPEDPLFRKGLQGYQAAQSENVQLAKIKFISDIHECLEGTGYLIHHSKCLIETMDKAKEQGTILVNVLGNLDRSEEKTEKYFADGELQLRILDGIKTGAEKHLEEEKQEKQRVQEREEWEQRMDISVSEEDVYGEISERNVDLALLTNKLATSVRKGVFGGKKENSMEYDNMVTALAAILEDPVRESPTFEQKERMNEAYEACQKYVLSHTGAKTAEGKKRLDWAKEAAGLLREMNPELKEKQQGSVGNRKQMSFRDLERESGRDSQPSATVRREVRIQEKKTLQRTAGTLQK